MKLVPVSIVLVLKDLLDCSFEVLMQKRNSEDSLNGMLEFPGGKIEGGESPEEAAVREFFEEVGVKIKQKLLHLFKIQEVTYGEKTILLHVFVTREDLINQNYYRFSFDKKSEEYRGKIPKINHTIIDQLIDFVKEQEHQSIFLRSSK